MQLACPQAERRDPVSEDGQSPARKRPTSIQKKIILALGAMATVLLVLGAFTIQGIIVPAFEDIERQTAAAEVRRASIVILGDADTLYDLLVEWTAQPVIGRLAQGDDAVAPADVMGAMSRLRLNVLGVVRSDGTMAIAGERADGRLRPAPEWFTRVLRQIPANVGRVRGIMITDRGLPALAAFHAIRAPNGGEPVALVGAARYLDSAYDVNLFRRLGARVTIETEPAGDMIPSTAVIRGDVVQAQAPFFDLFLDMFSDRALKISIELPRRFVPTMVSTLSQMNFMIAGIVALAGVLLWLVLRYQVFVPIRQITERIRSSSRDGSSSANEVVKSLQDLASVRRDEVGAIAAEMASLNDRIVQLANRDALTGIATRRPFCERLEYALLRAQRYSERVGILFIDLDGFKPVNDTYGHPAGDQVLKTVAARIVDTLRKADSVARLGGDEFAVLLEHPISQDDAALVADKVARAVSAPMQLGNVVLRIRASVGIAIFPDHGRDTESLMAAADQAMYLNKTSRNRRREGHRRS